MKLANSYFLVLDIETSTLFEDVKKDKEIEKIPKAVWLAYGFINLYDCKAERIEENYFREWADLYRILMNYSVKFSGYNLICFVHNLSYEFDFLMKNISRADKILSNSTHKVISATLKDFKNIEFRCTYQLSGYSLRKIGKDIGFEKLESEYRVIYPEDSVTDEEIEYCKRDCDIVAKYISYAILPQYKFLSDIPYTKTGRVRKTLQSHYATDKTLKDWDLMPPENCYKALNDAFSGGLCIVNPMFVGKVIKYVRCFDETSAYPYAALYNLFPYSIEKEENTSKFDLTKKFWIAKIKFNNITTKYSWGCLSISKMNDFSYNSEFFNGKLLSADYIVRTITNVDFEMINLCYDYESYEIIEYYKLEKYGKLPLPYIQTIEYYAKLKGELKEKLKHTEGMTEEEIRELEKDYMLAKNDFNSIYGMTVQKLMQSEYYINENFEWVEKVQEYKCNPMKHMKRNFLFGIYITAYARLNLIRGIVKNCPYTFIYSDTDSIKFIGINDFIDTNGRLIEYQSNPYIKNLGKFDEEQTYEYFKNYGAKKYAHQNNGKIELTVAGLPRNDYSCKTMDDFSLGRLFKDCKLGTKYLYKSCNYELDEEGKVICSEEDEEILDFYKKNKIESNGGIILYPTSYLLDMADDDKKYLADLSKEEVEQWQKKVEQQSGIVLTEYLDTI